MNGFVRCSVACSFSRAALLGALVAASPATPAWAALVDGTVGPLALQPTSFTQSDAVNNLTNPSVVFTNVTGYGSLTISYGAYFAGQSYSFDPGNPPPVQTGDAASSPLALAANQDLVAVVEDDTNPGAPIRPVVGGSFPDGSGGSIQTFIGPVAILFSLPVQGVELTAGSFASLGDTSIEAFAADGSSLGTVLNTATGYETFGLSDSLGRPISGLLLQRIDGTLPSLGVAGVGVFAEPPTPAVPAPGALPVLAMLPLLAWARRRFRPG